MIKEGVNYIVREGDLILPLTDKEKVEMIEFYFDCYFNTDQDGEEFAPEYYYLTQKITLGNIPCHLTFLSCYKEMMADRFPQYGEAINNAIYDCNSEWSEIRCTHFDEVEQKHYVDAWKTSDPAGEGSVIAKIDPKGNIEYLNDIAKTDLYAQEVISEVLQEIGAQAPEPDKAVFPIITKALQEAYEKANEGNKDETPEICGYYGRACRQLEKSEGANRMTCQYCGLAKYCG